MEGRYAEALTAKEAWLRAHDAGAAAELARIAEQRGRLTAEDREAREAHAAGMPARDLLLHARQLLGSAQGWATWDTFGGGGMLTDMMKYEKLDRVAAVLQQADIALQRFSRELRDVGVSRVDDVQVDGLIRMFDVFFDNIFTDLAVRSRIQQASGRVSRALAAVEEAVRRLGARGGEIALELGDLEGQRNRLLSG